MSLVELAVAAGPGAALMVAVGSDELGLDEPVGHEQRPLR